MSEYYINISKIIQVSTTRFIRAVNIHAAGKKHRSSISGCNSHQAATVNRHRHKLYHFG